LRLREGRRLGESIAGRDDHYVPGGRIAGQSLVALAGSETREDFLARLDRIPAPSIWREALESWVQEGELVTLERDLESAATKWTISLFWRGDPLGIAIPLAFITAKENEVRNLRLLAYGVEQGLALETVRQELVVPW